MPQVPITQVILETIGVIAADERWQVVIPLGCSAALDAAATASEVILDFENNQAALLQAVYSNNIEIVGIQVESAAPGLIFADRRVYTVGTYTGAIAGAAYSQQVSMLSAYYSADQAASGARIKTGKTFWGPPPESKCAFQTLDLAFVAGPILTLGNYFQTGFIGGTTGNTYKRVIGTSALPAPGPYYSSTHAPRGSVFTQRRRLTPIF